MATTLDERKGILVDVSVNAEHVIRALQQRIANDAYDIAVLQARITAMEIEATKATSDAIDQATTQAL